MSDVSAKAAAQPNQANAGQTQADKDRANARKMQNLLEHLNQDQAGILDNKDDDEKQDFLSILAKQTESGTDSNKILLDAFAKQAELKKSDKDLNVQTSAQGFITESPKMI